MNNRIEQVPGWMKAMQNGSQAEARARAFLMNRFWILERSVDINGADFLIQRRLGDKLPEKILGLRELYGYGMLELPIRNVDFKKIATID